LKKENTNKAYQKACHRRWGLKGHGGREPQGEEHGEQEPPVEGHVWQVGEQI
jgi:hypothetical protein